MKNKFKILILMTLTLITLVTTKIVANNYYSNRNVDNVDYDNINQELICDNNSFNLEKIIKLENKKFRDTTIFDGIIGSHYEYYIINSQILKYEGVYGYSTNGCLKSILEENYIEIKNSINFSSLNFSSNTIYYSNPINLKLESSLNTFDNLDFYFNSKDIKNEFNTVNDWSRVNDTIYFKEMKNSKPEKSDIYLSSDFAEDCPNAYNISVGIIGTFYTFDVHYIKYKNILGDIKVEEGTISCTIGDEGSMSWTIVYNKAANSDVYYYI